MISRASAATILSRLGWRVDGDRYSRALRDFQAGWNLGPALVIDGVLGEKSSVALVVSEKRRRDGRGTQSANFSFAEFKCKCGGRYQACRRIRCEGDRAGLHTGRALVQSLEVLRRDEYGGLGLTIVSGYRCTAYNRGIGGATSSQHLRGAAADIVPRASTNEVKQLSRFSGIGYQGSTGKVRHVDRRDASGTNSTGGSLTHPTVWKY